MMFKIISSPVLGRVRCLRLHSNRCYCSRADAKLENLRNIGILAHIDAGKTTTTERMLFYAGKTNFMGEVHEGNTVTDFMAQERERGITIKSAAVTLFWKGNRINLIDTPGHIDFTMEVEQSLSVLDGAIVILDGSAGIEAQTYTVSSQADLYRIPRMFFVNKMDRKDADFRMCCDQIESKLETAALPIQLPVKDTGGRLVSIIDVLRMENLVWTGSGGDGRDFERVRLETSDGELWETGMEARARLIDRLSDFDNGLAESVLKSGSFENISDLLISESLKKVTNDQLGVPVLCGSSYKNIGVQPLMDAVIDYLPNPVEKINYLECFGDSLCAKAFKIMHDKRGPLVFFRLLNGTLKKSQKLFNIQAEKNEQIARLLIPYANEMEEVTEVTNGNIAAVSGLKNTMIGHVVTASQSDAKRIESSARKQFEKKKMSDSDFKKIEMLLTSNIRIPEPVFFCSIEPPSSTYQTDLDEALTELAREDPSLRVIYNEETGQIVLSGMGELHLEIIRDRIIKEYGLDVELGPLQIAYKEEPAKEHRLTHELNRQISNTKQFARILLSVIPTSKPIEKKSGLLVLDNHPDFASKLSSIHPSVLVAINMGIQSAFNCGPKISCPVVNAFVKLHDVEIGRGTGDSIVSATASQCVRKILNDCGTYILEPIMKLQVVCDRAYLPLIFADLSKRRATIGEISEKKNQKTIQTLTPLSELLGYSSRLRSLTSGTASFTMTFDSYQRMSSVEETNAIKRVTGF